MERIALNPERWPERNSLLTAQCVKYALITDFTRFQYKFLLSDLLLAHGYFHGQLMDGVYKKSLG